MKKLGDETSLGLTLDRIVWLQDCPLRQSLTPPKACPDFRPKGRKWDMAVKRLSRGRRNLADMVAGY